MVGLLICFTCLKSNYEKKTDVVHYKFALSRERGTGENKYVRRYSDFSIACGNVRTREKEASWLFGSFLSRNAFTDI